MLPIELHQALRERLVGRIVQDYHWPGCDPRVLAGCCGRQVTGVRWIRGNGHMLLLFDAPQFPDEPADLLLPIEGVERVMGNQFQVLLWGQGRQRLALGIGPCTGHRSERRNS